MLPAAAFGAVAEDALVKRRVEELEAARIQQRARSAALSGDWRTVERLLREIEKLGVENEWVREVVRELRALAVRRDEAMFAKEARYQSRNMSSRLAAPSEYGAPLDAAVPSFLRRKSVRGKADPRPPRDPR